MSRAFLQSKRATSLVVEIDSVQGRRPSAGTLDHVRRVLERECFKPDGIRVINDDTIPAERSSYTFEDIERLEKRYRSRRSAGSTASIWMVFLNGELADDQGTLGVSYKASGAAIFADRVEGAATTLVQPGAIERSVTTHEVGHLLALVNIGYRSRWDHEDPDHPKHSNQRDSVMYWAIEDISVASILSGGPPDDFDRFDRDDLTRLREG